jgi:AcrR family transcriptional regulator
VSALDTLRREAEHTNSCEGLACEPDFDRQAISSLHPTSSARRTAILESATRAFSMFGLRGSSLRDIAKDAGVSLTLLDHHFGSKAMLLEAVVRSHSDSCTKKIAPLRASLMAVDGSLTTQRLIDEWVEYEFALSDTRQGRHDLHLVLRLGVDLEVDPALRDDINCSKRVIVDALRLLEPRLTERQVKSAWTLASSALYAAVLRIDELCLPGDRLDMADFRTETKGFLVAGLGRFAMLA